MSSDRDNEPREYTWDFGDGVLTTGEVVTHAYDDDTYTIGVSADDGHELPGLDSQNIVVVNVPPILNAGSNKTVDEGSVTALGIGLFGSNLITNPNAEGGTAGWSGTPEFTTQLYGTPNPVGDNSTVTGAINVSSDASTASINLGVALPLNLRDVAVSITWTKTDGSCTSQASGDAFHEETEFKLRSPSGTILTLVALGSYDSAADIGNISTTFTSSAPGKHAGGTPVSGTFRPD